jgi:hypothetical protein
MSFSPNENQTIGDKDTVATLTRSVLILVQVNTARIVYVFLSLYLQALWIFSTLSL